MDKAYFARYPRMIEDLQKLHLTNYECPYEVVMEITLASIDYENFVTDMTADRQFLEDNATLCSEGEIMRCLLVRQHGKRDGVLAVPDPMETCFVKWAAYIAD